MNGFRLSHLSVEGPDVDPAEIDLKAGLNVISGASDTGKSYVLSTIDFMLGATDPPKSIPEAEGYDRVYLGIVPHGHPEFTLLRSLKGGALNKYPVPRSEITARTKHLELGPKHAAGNLETVSGYLLALCGLDEKWVRENQYGKKRTVSYRDVAMLTLVDEQRIIGDRSPLLSEQYMWTTAEQSVFQLILTGIDDSAIVQEEKPAERKTRIKTQIAFIDELIVSRSNDLSEGATAISLRNDIEGVEHTIKQATAGLTSVNSELEALETKRQNLWGRHAQIRSRMDVIAGLQQRFKLLSSHYTIDRERLEAIAESGDALAERTEEFCPECGQKLSSRKPSNAKAVGLSVYQVACEAELGKIQKLESGLKATETDLTGEFALLEKEFAGISYEIRSVENLLERKIRPRAQIGEAGVADLLKQVDKMRTELARFEEIDALKKRRLGLEKALKEKKTTGTVRTGIETRNMTLLCERVESLLKTWRYPDLGRVSWDSEKSDFVIGARDRGSLGKGYRALTHAAFSISLMDYCVERDLPHPGMVVLDSPLTQLREKDEGPEGEISTEMKDAFYCDLASERTNTQIIVLENYDPRPEIQSKLNFIHFSKKKGAGRFGLFPTRKAQ